MRGTLLALALIGCNSPYPTCEVDYERPDKPDVVVAVHDRELEPHAECGAARWQRATGIRIAVDRGDLGDVSVRLARIDAAAWEEPAQRDIEVNAALVGDWYLPQIVAHELGHALESIERDHLAPGVHGLMSSETRADDDVITDADVELICGGVSPLAPCAVTAR